MPPVPISFQSLGNSNAIQNLLQNDTLPQVPVSWDPGNMEEVLIAVFLTIVVILLVAYVLFDSHK